MVVVAPTAADRETTGRSFHSISLDALNFLLADVRGALGPFLNVFLVTQQHWSQSWVGLVTTVAGWLGLAVQAPIGALIDATRAKRALIVTASIVLSLGAVAIFAAPSLWIVLIANSLIAMVGDVFGPAVAAITLGLYRPEQLARRIGRNAALDHAGNVFIAAVAGAIGWAFTQRAVFLAVPVFAALASIAALTIPANAIDHARARGAEPGDGAEQPGSASAISVLFTCRPLLVYAGCAMLFHFANVPLLPLVGQKHALAHPAWATAMMSSCIIAAQTIMLPIALLVGHTADCWGRKPILLIGFAILPVRAVLYTLSNDSAWLIGVQLLDGVGAGIFGAITPLVLADLMRGTKRYNLARAVWQCCRASARPRAGWSPGCSLIVSAIRLPSRISRGRRHCARGAYDPDARNRERSAPSASPKREGGRGIRLRAGYATGERPPSTLIAQPVT